MHISGRGIGSFQETSACIVHVYRALLSTLCLGAKLARSLVFLPQHHCKQVSRAWIVPNGLTLPTVANRGPMKRTTRIYRYKSPILFYAKPLHTNFHTFAISLCHPHPAAPSSLVIPAVSHIRITTSLTALTSSSVAPPFSAPFRCPFSCGLTYPRENLRLECVK